MNLEKVFDFIKEKRGYNYPLVYKLVNGLQLTEDDLNIKGTLDLYMIDIPSLPDNLTVGGNLDLRRTDINYLPNNLTVKGSLLISNNYIHTFPNNLKVGGYLHLGNTPLSKKYGKDEIRKMIEDKGGYVGGKIST